MVREIDVILIVRVIILDIALMSVRFFMLNFDMLSVILMNSVVILTIFAGKARSQPLEWSPIDRLHLSELHPRLQNIRLERK
jgi:hypothetical protein